MAPRRSLLCPICDDRPLDKVAYAYLLGLYLGDGHISHYVKHRVEWKPANQRRSVQNISIAKRASVALMDARIGPKY
ncbi:hypothetical protein [Streptomyces sp. NPDC092295]|uniref:hypothetical protein n=1 Tax=Streptomyces sp. NPDC092295 TaxID=3366011 RepID=UPI0037F700A7